MLDINFFLNDPKNNVIPHLTDSNIANKVLPWMAWQKLRLIILARKSSFKVFPHEITELLTEHLMELYYQQLPPPKPEEDPFDLFG